MKKKVTVIKKEIVKKKCLCGGKKKKCRACSNTGVYKEHNYIIIDEKNKIACGSDNLA